MGVVLVAVLHCIYMSTLDAYFTCPTSQALNDSGLGAAMIGGGMDDDLIQPIFSLGLKGVDPANADKVRLCHIQHLACMHLLIMCPSLRGSNG